LPGRRFTEWVRQVLNLKDNGNEPVYGFVLLEWTQPGGFAAAATLASGAALAPADSPTSAASHLPTNRVQFIGGTLSIPALPPVTDEASPLDWLGSQLPTAGPESRFVCVNSVRTSLARQKLSLLLTVPKSSRRVRLARTTEKDSEFVSDCGNNRYKESAKESRYEESRLGETAPNRP